jgi:hypothetical protein
MRVIEISEQDLSSIQALYSEIERTRLHVDALEFSLKAILQSKYGVDLTNETWAIDLQRGTLKHDTNYNDDIKIAVDVLEEEDVKAEP